MTINSNSEIINFKKLKDESQYYYKGILRKLKNKNITKSQKWSI